MAVVLSGPLTPEGFRRRPTEPVGSLRPVVGAPDQQQVRVAGEVVATLDGRPGLGESDVARLRELEAVHLSWQTEGDPASYARLVSGLALAGIPLTCEPVPTWARPLLAPGLVGALEEPGVTDDPLLREVRSIRQRRAAHADNGTPPLVSVLLATRRPEQLEFALRQVRRQRGVRLELVLAAHGWQPDPKHLDELTEDFPCDVVPVVVPSSVPFSHVLNDAAGRASSDLLLKMDDDDWYGRDFVSDLLLARSYSGADVVGTPPEFIFLEQLDLTVRRRDATEVFRPVVAGGTLLISRSTFEEVGGFPTRDRHVDAALLESVAEAGASAYRTHGHGYVLRRAAAGHTWDPGLGYFVSRSRTLHQWRGFVPSPLLDPDDIDLPRTAVATDA